MLAFARQYICHWMAVAAEFCTLEIHSMATGLTKCKNPTTIESLVTKSRERHMNSACVKKFELHYVN